MPATIATTVAAAKAFRMKSYSNIARVLLARGVLARPRIIVLVGVSLHVVAAGHDEDPVPEAHDVDLGTVKLRQHGSGDHLIDGAESGMAVSEVQHTVEGAEQRVQLMSAEQHRDAEFALKRLGQLHNLALMVRIQVDQRLVQQQ